MYQGLHGLQAAAGGDHVIHNDDLLALDQLRVVATQIQHLLGQRGDGLIRHGDGIGHIDLGALAGDKVLLRAALAGHFVDEGDALCLGGKEVVILDALQPLEHFSGGGHGDLRVAEADERADIQIIIYLADGKLALQTGDGHGICHCHNLLFLNRSGHY